MQILSISVRFFRREVREIRESGGGKMKTILFLGRSVEGILADARTHLGQVGEIVVVSRDNDTLDPPEGLTAVSVSNFEAEPGESYTVVANGGTASQLAPVLLRLCRAGVELRVVDLQRDGLKELK
jgi:hypothetical protein